VGVLFAVSNFIRGLMGLWNEEMKYETSVILIITKLTSVTFIRYMTSPSNIKRLFLHGDFASCVPAKRQSAAPTASSKKCMWVDELNRVC
jgi:hypothetical protein